jgi:hypothetical protein
MTNRGAYVFLEGQNYIVLAQIDLEIEKARQRGDEAAIARLGEIRITLDNEIHRILNCLPYDDE